ncbi:hypothetical protein D3C86_1274990 [compost metagenome]
MHGHHPRHRREDPPQVAVTAVEQLAAAGIGHAALRAVGQTQAARCIQNDLAAALAGHAVAASVQLRHAPHVGQTHIVVSRQAMAGHRQHQTAVGSHAFRDVAGAREGIVAVGIQVVRRDGAAAVERPKLELAVGGFHHLIGDAIDRLHLVDIPQDHAVARRKAMAGGRDGGGAAPVDGGDGADRAGHPAGVADRLGRVVQGPAHADSRRVADIDGGGVGHQRHPGGEGRLLILDHQLDQLLGRRPQILDLRCRRTIPVAVVHRPRDVQRHGHLDVARGAQDFRGAADRQAIVHQRPVGRQDDVGDQHLHLNFRRGDDGVSIQPEVRGVQKQLAVLVRLEIGRHIGLQRSQARLVQISVFGERGPGGGQGGGVQRVLQIGPDL